MAKCLTSCQRWQTIKSVKLQKANNVLHPLLGVIGPFVSIDSYCYLVTVVDYFSKYIKVIPICQKSADAVSNFLFSLMCCYGCFDIHITNQGRKFVNHLKGELTK